MNRLAREGWDITILGVDEFGQVSAESVAAALNDQTVLVSVMAADNEVGTINPIREIARVCRERGVLVHTDATQAVGKIGFDVRDLGVDLASFSGHKLYGPKGIGGLFVRRGEPHIRLRPLIDGGGQERGFRSGTLPVPLAVGLGRAMQLAEEEQVEESARIRILRDRLQEGIMSRVPEVRLNGHPTDRLPGNLNLSFAYVDGEALMMAMRDVAVSSGSACTAADPEPSHVLTAMGLDEDLTRASLRFGLGRFTTPEEIEFAIQAVATTVERLRSHSAVWTAGSRES
jgi:cysteine desulfurase